MMMSKGLRRILSTGVATAAVALGMANAQAGSFNLREQSTEAMGFGFAGVAAGNGGISSMFWNPATMTQFDGWRSSTSVTVIVPTSKTTGTVGNLNTFFGYSLVSNDIGQTGLLPASYQSYQVNDSLWLGLAINTPFGLTTKNVQPFAGGPFGETSHVVSNNFTPTIAYKLTDWLSVGGGVQIEHFNVRLTSLVPPPAGAPSYAQLHGSSWGYGYTLGATIKPFAGTEIGIGYRSQVKEKLEGSLASPTIPFKLLVAPIKSNVTLPDQVTVGISQVLTDRWTASAGFEWTGWSVFNSFPVVASGGPLVGNTLTNLAFRYRDGWLISVGAGYKYSDALTLRAGLGFERSPISDATRGVRITDNDRVELSVGAGYKYNEKLSLDFAYSHHFFKKSPISILPGSGNPAAIPVVTFVGSNRTSLDIISAGLTYRWDDPKVAEPAPLVRKY